MVGHLDAEALDGVLVEGFGHEAYPKVEVYRPSLGRLPQCWPHDGSVVAVASDVPLATGHLPRLDLNDLLQVASFVAHRLGLRWSGGDHPSESVGEAHHG
jgi:molybdopterin-guanine dinucleotide biosynthesis protein MobB